MVGFSQGGVSRKEEVENAGEKNGGKGSNFKFQRMLSVQPGGLSAGYCRILSLQPLISIC
jgi:hypothetical protein